MKCHIQTNAEILILKMCKCGCILVCHCKLETGVLWFCFFFYIY